MHRVAALFLRQVAKLVPIEQQTPMEQASD
jgi:hypothetical protein